MTNKLIATMTMAMTIPTAALAEDAKLARHRDEIRSVFEHLRPAR